MKIKELAEFMEKAKARKIKIQSFFHTPKGDPECESCNGRGYVTEKPFKNVTVVDFCSCVEKEERSKNVDNNG